MYPTAPKCIIFDVATRLEHWAAYAAFRIGVPTLLVLSMAFAGPQTPASKRATGAGGMSVEDVIKLVKAGLSEEIIAQQIKKGRRTFDLSTDQLIELKQASVSDRIIQIMMDPSRADAVASSGPPEAPSIPAAPEPSRPAGAPSAPKLEGPLPAEVGVYARKSGQWIEVSPEIVYWKTSGVAKSVATLGIVKGNVNGHVIGPRSPNVHALPIEFLIVALEGVAITEYQLVRLHLSKETREFRTVTGGVFHSQSGAARDLLAFEGTKTAPHVFRVIFSSSQGPGEYGFLPPGSTGASGKIYSFHVAE